MVKKKLSQSEFKKNFTTVTPLSKAIALMIFIILPFVGVLVGMKYQKLYDMALYKNSVPVVIQNPWMATVTDTDNGTTKYLKVGDKITASNTGAFSITGLKSSDSLVLSRVTDDTFQAMTPGTAILSTYVRPHCTRGQLCSQLAMQYSVTVIVK